MLTFKCVNLAAIICKNISARNRKLSIVIDIESSIFRAKNEQSIMLESHIIYYCLFRNSRTIYELDFENLKSKWNYLDRSLCWTWKSSSSLGIIAGIVESEANRSESMRNPQIKKPQILGFLLYFVSIGRENREKEDEVKKNDKNDVISVETLASHFT